MEERSKTNKEIFYEKYATKAMFDNPLLIVEAIGYLKALIQYFPREEKWAQPTIAYLLTILPELL